MIPNLKPEMQELIQNISQKNMYYGNKIPESIMSLFKIIETDMNCGIEAPYWLGVLQRGRGVRESSQSSDLWKKIYRWMEKRNMFKSTTAKGKLAEAKSLTWYINKYGNQQFRNKVFIDVYQTVRRETIEKINKKFSDKISKITMEIL